MIIKKAVKIKLNGLDDAQEFSRIASQYIYDIDVRSGKYVVNGKSILGLLSLNLTSPLTVDIYSDDVQDFLTRINKFLIN